MMLESQAATEALEREASMNGSVEEDPFKAIADKRAKKVLKKHSKEISRLKKHAEKCLFELNKDGYIYAIGKIRTIIRKPMDQESLGVLYDTSVERLIEIANEATKSIK